MQAKNVEPGTHSGVARYFGMIFFFQALASLFMALSEQLYEGYLSLYLAVMCVICAVTAVCICIPAAAVVAVPEANKHALQAVAYVVCIVVVVLSSFVLSKRLQAAPDIPYISQLLRRELLGAIVGALVVVGGASAVRIARDRKGKNGAFILLCGLVLMGAFGVLWVQLEPVCKVSSATDEWPHSCPMSRLFDHNFMMTVFVLVANVLTAEGVLRLMAAGSGVQEYDEIVPIINTT